MKQVGHSYNITIFDIKFSGMKKLLLSILILLCIQLVIVKAQWITIPNANMVTKLTLLYPSCMNGNLMDTTCTQIVNEDSLSISFLPIADFTGIQYFDSLKYLKLYYTSTSILPSLPKTLKYLNCSNNSLTALPDLPNSLITLICDVNQQITSLPLLPSFLEELSTINNYQIVNLPLLPSSLTKLSCDFNGLISLPVLPSSLKWLSCINNDLNSLPALPSNLDSLKCSSNQLTSLPILPGTLKTLDCSANQLTGLPTLPNILKTLNCSANPLGSLPIALPSTLKTLICANNQLTSLNNLPDSLIHLNFNGNILTSFPQIPDSLKILSCSYCQFTSLPVLPDALQFLTCFGNQLISLPALPNTLQWLGCYWNHLTYLPPLPNSMTQLSCGNNQLTSLPPLPINLSYLDCSENQISTLPAIPNSLDYLFCNYNQITYVPQLPNVMIKLVANNNNISCLNNLPQITTSYHDISNNPLTCVPNQTSYSLGLPLCIDNDPINNPNSCLSTVNISGYVYTDINNDCTHSAGDLGSSNIPVKLYDSLNNLISQYYTSGGTYGFAVGQPGTYKVLIDTLNMPFSLDCSQADTQIVNLVSIGTSVNNNNFPIYCNEGFDANVQSVISQGWNFPAQIHTLQTNISNNESWYQINCDSLTYSGTVTIQVTGPVTYVSPTPDALIPQVNGNTFTYNITDFNTLSPASFGLRLMTDTFAQMGSQICAHIEISTIPIDADTSNDVYDYCYNVVNSYDPNLKEVYPVNLLPGSNEWFTYTIHFQNTGTAPAFNILLKDTLDEQLDLNTFEIRGYSHTPIVTLFGNILNVRFNNIMLPDSTTDYEGSMGYFQYRIKPLANLPNGAHIKNTAHIYFDYNTAIVTNTALSSFNCQPINFQQTMTICQGDSLQIGNSWYSSAGNHTAYLISPYGCDSIVETNLTLTVPNVDTTLAINGDTLTGNPSNQNYEWINCATGLLVPGATSNLFVAPYTGDFKAKITSINGCSAFSSCFHLIKICPQNNTQQSITICLGDSVQVGNNWYSTSGTFTNIFLTANGCDSVVTSIINQTIIDTALAVSADTVYANSNYVNYEWINCTNGLSIQSSNSNSFIIPFTGNFRVKITSNNGCNANSPCITVTASCQQINAQQSITICDGDSLQVGNNWYSIAGNFNDSLLTANGCDSIVTTILSETIIDTSLVLIGDTLVAILGYANYEWIDCITGMTISSEASNTLMAPYSGIFKAAITTINGCVLETYCMPLVITGNKSINSNPNEIIIYPNPSNGEFSFNDNKNINNVEVYNILGEQILTQGNQKLINLSEFARGIYYARINGETVLKLVKD